MAVVDVSEIRDGRGSNEGGISSTTATRVFRVKVDDATDDRDTILGAGLLPVLYSSHPSNVFLTARTMRLEHIHKLAWLATVEYSTAPLEQERVDREGVPNPVDRRARIRWGAAEELIVLNKDRDGDPIVNSAGDEYDPESRQVEVSNLVVYVQKSVANLPTFMLNVNNRVNTAAFQVRGVSFPAETLKVKNFDVSDDQVENGFTFLAVSFELHYDADQWKLELLDRGYRRIDPVTSTERIPIVNDDGTKPTEPVLLDGAGAPLANPSAANAVFNEFEVAELLDFSLLAPLVV